MCKNSNLVGTHPWSPHDPVVAQAHRLGAEKRRLLSVLRETCWQCILGPGGPGVPAGVGGGGAQRWRRTESAQRTQLLRTYEAIACSYHKRNSGQRFHLSCPDSALLFSFSYSLYTPGPCRFTDEYKEKNKPPVRFLMT